MYRNISHSSTNIGFRLSFIHPRMGFGCQYHSYNFAPITGRKAKLKSQGKGSMGQRMTRLWCFGLCVCLMKVRIIWWKLKCIEECRLFRELSQLNDFASHWFLWYLSHIILLIIMSPNNLKFLKKFLYWENTLLTFCSHLSPPIFSPCNYATAQNRFC